MGKLKTSNHETSCEQHHDRRKIRRLLEIRKAETNKYQKFLNSNKGNLGKTSTISLFGKLIEKKS